MSPQQNGNPQIGRNIYPIIFVPCLMGTTLADNYPIDHNVVYNAVFDKFANFDPIMIDDSGQYDIYLDRYIRGNELVPVVYNKIVMELREELLLIKDSPLFDEEFVKVYLFPYDWRYSIASNAKRLERFVVYNGCSTYTKQQNVTWCGFMTFWNDL